MQFFPTEMSMTGIDSLFSTSTNVNGAGLFGASSSNGGSSGTGSFSAFLDLAQKSVQHEMQKNEEYSPSDPLEEAPYSSNADIDSAFYSFDEVGFTKSDLFQLHHDLVRAGAQTEHLDKLRTLIDKPDGANISQVLASLMQENEPVKLSEDEQLALTSLLTKIDSTGGLENEVNLLLESGQGLAAWSMISEKISTLDENQSVNVSKNEIAVLGKAIGISEQAQTQLLSVFGASKSLNLAPKDLLTVLSPVQSNLVEESLNQDKLQEALDVALGPILLKATERFQAAKDAASLVSKNVQHSDILIKETVTAEARNNLEQAATGEKSTVPTQNSTNKDSQVLKNEHTQKSNTEAAHNLTSENAPAISTDPMQNTKTANEQGQNTKNLNGTALPNEQGQNTKNLKGTVLATEQNQNAKAENPLIVNQIAENNINAKDAVTSVKTDNNNNNNNNNTNTLNDKNLQQELANNNSANDNGKNTPDNKNTPDKSKDTSWDNLLSKVDVQQSSSKADTSFSGVMGLQSSDNPTSAENVLKNVPNTPPRLGYSEQNVANQVERGLLSAMKNGTKRLELQLNPGDLGTINLILTSSRTGEISASIRTDRPETAEVMQRQLDVIRVSLEQQGIKIDKLDVHYESPNKQNNNSWDDMHQHNNQQEQQQARQEQLERLRNLRTVRNSDTNSQNNSLVQDMHISTMTANNSTTSLHVVA